MPLSTQAQTYKTAADSALNLAVNPPGAPAPDYRAVRAQIGAAYSYLYTEQVKIDNEFYGATAALSTEATFYKGRAESQLAAAITSAGVTSDLRLARCQTGASYAFLYVEQVKLDRGFYLPEA